MVNMNSGSFVEMYKNYTGYGYGSMLIHISETRRVEYVLFKPDDQREKEVINERLLEVYNQQQNEGV